MKSASLFISSFVIAFYCIAQCTEWLCLSLDSPWWTRLTYLLVHGSCLHTAVNVYSVLALAFLANARAWQGLAAFVVALFIPDCVLADTPIAGLSTYIYAQTGIVVMQSKRWVALVCANLILIAASFFFMDLFAVWPHIWCFSCGIFIGLITSKRLHYD